MNSTSRGRSETFSAEPITGAGAQSAPLSSGPFYANAPEDMTMRREKIQSANSVWRRREFVFCCRACGR
jgi:hypothetical protein